MREIYEAAFSAVNIIPTLLFLFVILYWVVVMVGFIDLEALHLDVAKHIHLEVAKELPGDIAHDVTMAQEVEAGDHETSWLISALAFFGVGKVPFMLFLSFLVLPLWALSVLLNHYLHNTSFLLALVLLIPTLYVSLFIAKFLTWPLGRLFAHLEKDVEKGLTLVGKICTLTLPVGPGLMGQALFQENGNTLVLNVKTLEENLIAKGRRAVVAAYYPEKNYYLVEALD